MVKKIAILIMFVLVISQMIIVVSADITNGTIPHTLPNYITGTYGFYDGKIEDRYFARAYSRSNLGIRIPKDNYVLHVPYISRLYTGLESGKLYKWQYTFGENIVSGVGDIAPTNYSNISIVTPANLNGLNLDPYIDANMSFATAENPYLIGGYTYSIPTDNYRMFYDSNNKTLTCIMILPDNYFDGMEALQMHCYIMVALGDVTNQVTENITVTATDSVPLHVQGDYTELLKEISAKIENVGTGGITPEHITESIQQALRDHDLQVEDETSGKLDQIMEQINGIVSPYKDAADEINNAFDGLSDVFASSSTASVFKFPEGRMPNGVLLWQEHNIDIGAAWNQLPAKFRSVVQIVCTFTILYIVIQEAVFVIKFIILGRKGSTDD